MRRAGPFVFVSLMGLALFGSVSTTTRPAEAATSVEECVNIVTTPDAKGASFSVANNCDRGLSCQLAWTVECLNGCKVTKASKGNAQFSVAASATHSQTGSAQMCNGDWRIDQVRWDCRPSK